jgi:DNA-binding NtrC family response regulator
MTRLRILIADDEKAARHGMMRALSSSGYELLEAADGNETLALLRGDAADLAFLDLNMPGLDGVSVLRELGAARRSCEIVVVTANDSVAAAVECMRYGATDYITKPFEIERLRAIARRVARRIELEGQVSRLETQLDEQHAFGALVGASRPMRHLYEQITRAARANVDVLLCGETGTGKELIAREIHRLSDRAAGPFIAVNTAAIAESLAESELFGHARGAFTGANSDRKGVFEQAHGGTLFLDEIGDMPLPAQAKILRTLQERVVQPVGTARTVHVDVRVISATHQKLEEAIAAGQFREDLYYRIRGVQLQIVPLRSRPEDILVLANYFLDRCPVRDDKLSRRLSKDAIERLITYHWPGNVRELKQVVTAAAAMTTGETIGADDLNIAQSTGSKELPAPREIPADLAGLPLSEAKSRLVESFERSAIEAALAQHDGNVSAAARQLGMHRQSLQQKMTQLSIRRT